MRITEELLIRYGFTEDCDGCKHKKAGMHKCRKRLEEAMAMDEEGRAVHQRAQEREEEGEEDTEAIDEQAVAAHEEGEEEYRKRALGDEGGGKRSKRARGLTGGASEDDEGEARGESDRDTADLETSLTEALRRMSIDVAEIYSPPGLLWRRNDSDLAWASRWTLSPAGASRRKTTKRRPVSTPIGSNRSS